MIFRKLKRVWSNDTMHYIPNFRETFPELRNVSDEELSDRWYTLGIDLYTQEEKKVNIWIRFTIPFALILILIMFISLPLVFIITGRWGYSLSDKGRIYNWFRSLGLT